MAIKISDTQNLTTQFIKHFKRPVHKNYLDSKKRNKKLYVGVIKMIIMIKKIFIKIEKL